MRTRDRFFVLLSLLTLLTFTTVPEVVSAELYADSPGRLSGTAKSWGQTLTLLANGSDGKIELKWPVRNALVRYNIYRSFFPNDDFKKLNDKPVDDAGGYVDSTVSNGTIYYYYVEALNDQGVLDRRSDVITAGAGAPIKSARLVPIYDAQLIQIRLSVHGLSFIGSLTLDSTQEQYVIAQVGIGLHQSGFAAVTDWQPFNLEGGSYQVNFAPRKTGDYEVIARFSTDGGLHWTFTKPVDFTVLPPESTTPPASPANVRITQASLFNVTLSWDAVPGAYAYRVYSGTGKAAKLLVETTTTTFRDIDALEGQTYTYTVTAFDQSLNESQPTSELVANVP